MYVDKVRYKYNLIGCFNKIQICLNSVSLRTQWNQYIYDISAVYGAIKMKSIAQRRSKCLYNL